MTAGLHPTRGALALCLLAAAAGAIRCGAPSAARTATPTSVASTPAPTATPAPVASTPARGASLVTTPCVLHSGSAQGTASSGGAASHAACTFDAECIAVPGTTHPGDGFVGVTCEDRACRCEWRAADSDATASEAFALDALPSAQGACRALLLERCMRGMSVTPREPPHAP